jgi:hypothetical protein
VTLRESTAGGSTFDAVEALVLMAVAVLIVVLFDGVSLVLAGRHAEHTPKVHGTSDAPLGPSIDFGDHR